MQGCLQREYCDNTATLKTLVNDIKYLTRLLDSGNSFLFKVSAFNQSWLLKCFDYMLGMYHLMLLSCEKIDPTLCCIKSSFQLLLEFLNLSLNLGIIGYICPAQYCAGGTVVFNLDKDMSTVVGMVKISTQVVLDYTASVIYYVQDD